MSKSSNFSHWLGVTLSGTVGQVSRLPASSGWSLRSWRRTFSTALLTRLTTWNLSKVSWALGRLATIPLAKACDMSALTSVTALGSPPWALRSSAKAATVEASLPGVANNTFGCSRSTKRETYFWPRRGGGFIDADLGDCGMVGFGAGCVHVVGDDAPNQGVVLVDEAGHPEDRHGLGEHHDQSLEQQGEAAGGSGPGERHAGGGAAGTLDGGGAGVEESLVLEKVQVPPGQIVRVVGFAGNPANRAREDAAPRKIQIDIQASGRLLKGAATDQPRRQQPQGCLK